MASLATPIGANAQSSASFKVQGAVVDTAGGVSTSQSHVLVSCVGSEIAGQQASINHRIDSGCGAVTLFVPATGGAGGDALPVPTMSGGATVVLAVAVLAAAAAAMRRRRALQHRVVSGPSRAGPGLRSRAGSPRRAARRAARRR
jgi:hypothetical protein